MLARKQTVYKALGKKQIIFVVGLWFRRSFVSKLYDVAVIGGGLVGLSTARELLLRHPELKLALLEKERNLAQHQSGNNSGVIHSGVYYAPGSYKAKLCVEGADLMYDYCDKKGITYRKCGKVIVAVEMKETSKLRQLYEQGIQNGVRDIRIISGDELKRLEPNSRGVAAIHIPHTGIVNYVQVANSYAEDVRNSGGDIFLNYMVTDFQYTQKDQSFSNKESFSEHSNGSNIIISGKGKDYIASRYVITCCGLYSDHLAVKSGCDPEPKIVPFRGTYLVLKKDKCDIVKGNIYPVPDPKLPFLGVHFTPRTNGEVWLGPNALFAFAREGYRFLDVNPKETIEALRYKGLIKLVGKHWQTGFQEIFRALFLPAQIKQLQRYVPSLRIADVTWGPSGVRAQALDGNGNLIDDFIFDTAANKHILHIRNAPSPAATSSLAIAKVIADKVNQYMNI